MAKNKIKTEPAKGQASSGGRGFPPNLPVEKPGGRQPLSAESAGNRDNKPNPFMNKNLQLKEPVTKFIEKLKEINRKYSNKPAEKIKVSYVASSLSFLYEKVRNTVDYKDEHLLRKYAIERILNRLIFIEGKRERLAEALLTDLIRGRYFRNDSIGVNKIGETDEIIGKYLVLLDKSDFKGHNEKDVQKMINWLLGILSFNIEKKLAPCDREEALCEFVYDSTKKDILIKDGTFTEREKILQVYIAILRAVFKADRSILSFYLFKVFWPDWFTKDWESIVDELGKNIFSVKNVIESEIDHPAGERLYRFFKRRAVVYFIIFDFLAKDLNEASERMVSSKLVFLEDIRQGALARYKKAKETLTRTFTRSVIYIFLTKIVMAFIIEVPYELMQIGHINFKTLGINVIFHPSLMYVVGSSIKMPTDKNTAQIIREAEYIIYQKKSNEPPPYTAKFNFLRSSTSKGMYFIFYSMMFVITFGIIIYILKKLDFNIVSGALFTLFLSVVSFFALKIGQPVRDLQVIDKKDKLVDVMIDFFYIPVANFGRWMSERFSQVNIFVFILDFIIEAPFKSFIKIFDDWVRFLREKKEEMT